MHNNQNDNPVVSVVIPMYNRQNVIGRAIESVLRQTFTNFEVIIIDDCSSDNSCSVVEQYTDSRIKLIRCDENHGANYCRNIGIKESTGKYIAFQDSDDEWTKDKLEIQIQYMIEKDASVSFSPYIYADSNEIIPSNYLELSSDKELLRTTLKKYNVVGTPTLVIRKDIVNTVGVFDDKMPRLQDYEYVLRIIQKYNIVCCPHILLRVYTDNQRITSDNYKLDVAVKQILKKYNTFIDIDNFFAIRNIFLNENYMFSESIFEEMMLDDKLEQLRLTGINLLRRELTRQEDDRSLLFQININRLVNKEFAIYGAGKYANELYTYLYKMNKLPKYFIVTDCSSCDMVDNIEVKKIDEVCDKKITVIVAVASKTQNEILKLLYEEGFNDVFTV